MVLNEQQQLIIQKFIDQQEESKKKFDEQLEKAYQKKENSLTENIKNKTREFKEALLKNNFQEADFYVESRLWQWKFFKQTLPNVAFVVNLEPHNDYLDIYYGYASTAFTQMAGCAASLNQHGVDSDEITVRSLIKYTYGDPELSIWSTIQSFYDQYANYSKDELLTLAKERKKDFLNAIKLKLKPLGLKKRGNRWSISLNQHYNLSFSVEKTRFCDSYRFFYDIQCVDSDNPYRYCCIIPIGYDYKDEKQDYDWQCHSAAELDRFFEFIIEDILLPIINCDTLQLNDLIAEINTARKPRFYIPAKEEIKLYNIIWCDSENCDHCFKKMKA